MTIRSSELNDLSLTALLAGMTIMREARVHTDGISALCVGKSSRRYPMMDVRSFAKSEGILVQRMSVAVCVHGSQLFLLKLSSRSPSSHDSDARCCRRSIIALPSLL